MLVLTRKPDQKIQIGDNICITIVRVKGQSVRIGIDAPKEVRVMRTELTEGESAETPDSQPQMETMEVALPQEQAAKESTTAKASVVSIPICDANPEQRRNPCFPKAGRTPGASCASSVRRPQRLGPAVLRTMK